MVSSRDERRLRNPLRAKERPTAIVQPLGERREVGYLVPAIKKPYDGATAQLAPLKNKPLPDRYALLHEARPLGIAPLRIIGDLWHDSFTSTAVRATRRRLRVGREVVEQAINRNEVRCSWQLVVDLDGILRKDI